MLLIRYGYAVVFGALLLENLGLPLPGFAFLIAAGALAGMGKLSIPWTILVGVLGALIGDLVWYGLGHWRGRGVLGFLCRLSANPDTCVGSTERLFMRYGLPTLLVAKFLPGVNTVAPPLMGTIRASFPRFLAYDSSGALIFASVSVGAGYLLGWDMVGRAQTVVSGAGAWLGWGFAGFGLGYVAWRVALRLRVRHTLRSVGLTPAELRQKQEAGAKLTVIDVRTPLAVRERPMLIPGAIRAGHDEIHQLTPTLPPDHTVVTYCD